ncbi:hypothetical protein EV121DRAFT_297059 [Schizophyllum commune]
MFSAINQALNGPRRMLWTFSAVLAVAGGVMYKAKQSVDARRKADLEAFRAGELPYLLLLEGFRAASDDLTGAEGTWRR